jgi:hypothetical protein
LFADESSAKPRPKRNSRVIATTRLPEQPKPKPINQKPPPHNLSNKSMKKANKVTFNDDPSTVGVFMTMDEISELVKAVKESNQNPNNTTVTETQGILLLINFNMFIFIRIFKNQRHRQCNNRNPY